MFGPGPDVGHDKIRISRDSYRELVSTVGSPYLAVKMFVLPSGSLQLSKLLPHKLCAIWPPCGHEVPGEICRASPGHVFAALFHAAYKQGAECRSRISADIRIMVELVRLGFSDRPVRRFTRRVPGVREIT